MPFSALKSYIWLIQTICKSKVYIFVPKNSTWTQFTEKTQWNIEKTQANLEKNSRFLAKNYLQRRFDASVCLHFVSKKKAWYSNLKIATMAQYTGRNFQEVAWHHFRLLTIELLNFFEIFFEFFEKIRKKHLLSQKNSG